MPTSSEKDPHGVLIEMKENGSYVSGDHIVYKAGTHGEKYLDKDSHLKSPDVAPKIVNLLSEKVPEGAIVIMPETRSEVKLGKDVAYIVHGRLATTQKNEQDIHTFSPEMAKILKENRPRVLVDDILNNWETLRQVQKALAELGFSLDSFHVMVDRNPTFSATIDIPLHALATVQMDQWNEADVPEKLKNKPISTKLGKGRNWIPKPGQELSMQFYLERLHKENLSFYLDDKMKVRQIDVDQFMLIQQ